MRSSFFGAVSSGSGHRSVGYHRPCGRRRSETKSSGRGPWDVGLCVVRVSRRDAASGENRAVGREIWHGSSQPPRRACSRVGGRGNWRRRRPYPVVASVPVCGGSRTVCGRLFRPYAAQDRRGWLPNRRAGNWTPMRRAGQRPTVCRTRWLLQPSCQKFGKT